MSTLGSRYEDVLLDGANTFKYDYAPPTREHENDGLKRMTTHTPVILLKQVKPTPRPEYMVVAPLYVDAFNDQRRQFVLSTRAEAIVQSNLDEPLVVPCGVRPRHPRTRVPRQTIRRV